ncbi:MAG: lysylphosphatidylglycerol synthase transmembrane domain-containing protein [Anaerolineae bacterium]
MNRKTILNLLKIIVSAGLIALILRSIDLRELGRVLARANLGWLAAALAFSFGGVAARAKRWHILLDALRVRVPFTELLQIYFIGFLFNNLLPSGLGGDAIRMMELNRHSERAGDAVSSVLVDRMLGVFGSLSLALAALAFRWRAVPAQIAVLSILLFAGLTGVGLALINQSLYHALRRIPLIRRLTGIRFAGELFRSFQTYNLPTLGRSYTFSLLLSLCLIGMNMSIGRALGASISAVHFLVFVPLASLVLILPISFAGLGVREGAYVYLFGQVGVPQEVALGLSLLVYVLGNAMPGLLGGVVYLWRSARGIKNQE